MGLAVKTKFVTPAVPNNPTFPKWWMFILPGFVVGSWFGMFAPAKTPPNVIERLSREIKKASTDPKFVGALAPQGMSSDLHASAEYRAHLVPVIAARAVAQALRSE